VGKLTQPNNSSEETSASGEKKMSKDQSMGDCDGLPCGGYKCNLQHHMELQVPLSCIKELPFLLGGDAHVIKGHTGLLWLVQNICDKLLS
jgi:hypothetical protein